MASYEIQFKQSVAKDLHVIPSKDVKKILKKIDMPATNPRAAGCVKLSGQERYRLRQGVYGIIYEIKDTAVIVLVVKVAHRSQIYKNS